MKLASLIISKRYVVVSMAPFSNIVASLSQGHCILKGSQGFMMQVYIVVNFQETREHENVYNREYSRQYHSPSGRKKSDGPQ